MKLPNILLALQLLNGGNCFACRPLFLARIRWTQESDSLTTHFIQITFISFVEQLKQCRCTLPGSCATRIEHAGGSLLKAGFPDRKFKNGVESWLRPGESLCFSICALPSLFNFCRPFSQSVRLLVFSFDTQRHCR